MIFRWRLWKRIFRATEIGTEVVDEIDREGGGKEEDEDHDTYTTPLQ